MADKGIDSNGLLYILQRIKANFALKSHTHSTSDINSGNIVTGVKGNSETNYRTGQVNITAANVGAAASSHTHGNIQNGGTLQTTDVAIASGDKLVITDSSDSSKVARASIAFDGSTATQALTKKGTWETFNNYSLPTAGADTKGGVKIGAGLTMTGEVLSADVQSVPAMTGATADTAGAAGLVPAPSAGNQAKYLQGDGTWDMPAARHGSGSHSVNEGVSCTTSGNTSHAEGSSNTASGSYSHVEGLANVANHESQHVFGEYNVPDDSSASSSARGNYIEIVGNGTVSAHSNARTLDWSGNEVLAGTLTTGGDVTVPSGSKFNGSGAGLTSLNGSNISSGTVAAARLPDASSSAKGAMSAAHYSKLEALPTNATLQATYALKSDITAVYKHKGSVSTKTNLPTTGNTAGDVYNVVDTGMNYVWVVPTSGDPYWDDLGSLYEPEWMTNSEIDAVFTSAGLTAAA